MNHWFRLIETDDWILMIRLIPANKCKFILIFGKNRNLILSLGWVRYEFHKFTQINMALEHGGRR